MPNARLGATTDPAAIANIACVGANDIDSIDHAAVSPRSATANALPAKASIVSADLALARVPRGVQHLLTIVRREMLGQQADRRQVDRAVYQ
jgi:hypothetical protein